MNDVIDTILLETQAAGLILDPEPPKLFVRPEERLTPELEERLRQHKPAIIERLEGQRRELEASMKRLEAADISFAIIMTETDGGLAITQQYPVQGEEAKRRAWASGAIVFHPDEMYAYVRLTQRERKMLHEFKKRFDTTVRCTR